MDKLAAAMHNNEHDTLNQSPLGKLVLHSAAQAEFELKREEVFERFGHYLPSEDAGNFSLSLHPFVQKKPLCYHSTKAFNEALSLFEHNPLVTLQALARHSQGWSHAIDTLFREGKSWDKEEQIKLNRPSDLLMFEQIWHPEYQRFAEHAFNHLINVPLEILGIKEQKNYVSLALAERAKKLHELGFPAIMTGFSSVVRNAISHGTTYFGDHEIRYSGKKHEETLFPSSFGRLFDSLVDTCSGIVAAVLVFIINHPNEVLAFGLVRLPIGLRCILLQGWISHANFKINGAIEVRFENDSHLNIYCASSTKSRRILQWESVRAAVYAIRAGYTNFNRICISIDCGLPIHSSVIFDCQKIIDALKPNASFEDIANIIMNNLLWYDSNWISQKIYILKSVLSGGLPKMKREMVLSWKKSGLNTWKYRYMIRKIENRTAGRKRRILAEIVVNENEDISMKLIEEILLHAVNVLRKKRIPSLDFGKTGFFRDNPSYIWLRLHRKDGRIRTLQTRMHDDADLLAEAEWMTWINRHRPIYLKKYDATFKSVRIKFRAFSPSL